MSALGFRSSGQGQVNLGLVASHNPGIIKAYGGMMGALFALVMAAVFARTRRYGILRLHGHSWLHHASRETLHAVSVAACNGFGQCADPRLLQRFNSMDAMVSLVNPDMAVAVLLTVEIVTLGQAQKSWLRSRVE